MDHFQLGPDFNFAYIFIQRFWTYVTVIKTSRGKKNQKQKPKHHPEPVIYNIFTIWTPEKPMKKNWQIRFSKRKTKKSNYGLVVKLTTETEARIEERELRLWWLHDRHISERKKAKIGKRAISFWFCICHFTELCDYSISPIFVLITNIHYYCH